MSEWTRVPVSAVAVHKGLVGGPFGSSLGSKDYVPSGVPVIRGANLSSLGKFDSSEFVFVTPEKAHGPLARNLAIPGDVVFTQRGTLGQVGVVPSGQFESYVISQSQMRLRVDEGLALPEFIYYQFRSPVMVGEIHSRAIATGVPHINLGILSRIEVSLPPLKVQQGIVELLGSLDDKIASNVRIVRTSLALADAHYQMARKNSPEVAAVTIGELASGGHIEFGDGYRTKRSEHGRPGVPILRVAEVHDFRISPALGDYVSEKFRPKMGKKVSRAGDIVLTTKGTVGRAAIIPNDGREYVYSPQVCYFRTATTSPISSQVLYLWMRSQEFRDQAAPLKSQTDMADYLSLSDIRSMRITLLGEDTHAGVRDIGRSLLDRAEESNEESCALAALRDTLLPQLMSGKLRVRDAERIVEDAV